MKAQTSEVPTARFSFAVWAKSNTCASFCANAWKCARRAPDRDLESFNVNARICAHQSTDRDLESVIPEKKRQSVTTVILCGPNRNIFPFFSLTKSCLNYSTIYICNHFYQDGVPEATKIPDATAAVDKEWKRFETIPAWQLEEVKSKKEVILEAQRDKKNVHFASLMDMCHLKNADLEP